MNNPLLIISIPVIIFYFLIPGVGAFLVRSRWRGFRKRMITASLWPSAGYSELREAGIIDSYRKIGRYRFFGALEAIQSDDYIWLSNGRISMAARMEGIKVYLLPSATEYSIDPEEMIEKGTVPDEMPRRISWERLGTLSEGTKFFVSGALYAEDGHAVFRSDEEEDLAVVIYEGPEESFLLRSIWSGRQQNEYWNHLTPGALAVGSFSLLIIAYIFLRSPLFRLPVAAAISFAAAPILSLFPPGVAFFFLYRWLWRRGRFLRAERDLLRLPLRYFSEEGQRTAELPNGEAYEMWEEDADKVSSYLDRGFRLRSPLVIRRKEETTHYTAFGSPRDNGELIRPGDPLSEAVIVAGNPKNLSEQSEKKARLYELSAGTVLGFGLILNIYFLFVFLSRIIR